MPAGIRSNHQIARLLACLGSDGPVARGCSSWSSLGRRGLRLRLLHPAPFDKSVKTVFVPVLKTQSFRRDLNLNLTEMIQKEIMHRTPYKVVGTPEEADTILEGTINLRRQEHRGREPVQPASRAERDRQRERQMDP